MPELSIIVPVYKVEKYLPKCIDSILAQTFTDFELILIDDGSPDRCGEICDKYASIDSRIKVIHQKNQGVSAARNAGLDIATGTYLGFVDSDDWIEPEMYEMMILTAEKEQSDIVICGIRHYNEESMLLFEEKLTTSGKYNGEQMLKLLYSMPNVLGGCIWNKIYRFAKIEKIRYRVGVAFAEDRLYLFDVYSVCESGIKISLPLYSVTEREGSTLRRTDPSIPYGMVMGSYRLTKCAKGYSKELWGYSIDKFLDDCLGHIPLIKKTGRISRKSYLWKFIKTYFLMLRYILLSYIYKQISKNKIHGYIYGAVKMLTGEKNE